MLRLRVLGSATLTRDGVSLAGRATQRRRVALLALLASAGGRGLSRERAIAYLWPEVDAERGRHSLSQILYAIRRDLGVDPVVATLDDLRLDSAVLGCDLIEFLAALEQGDWARAVELHRGPFLDGVHLTDSPEFERWAASERERLAGRVGDAIEQLAKVASDSGDGQAAVGWWRRRAAQSPLDSRIALELMRALAAVGDRAAALRHGHAHTRLLASELGIAPDPAVTELVDDLADRTEPAAPASDSTVPSIGRGSGPSLAAGPEAAPRARWPRWSWIGVALAAAGLVGWAASHRGSGRVEPPRQVVLGVIGGPNDTLSAAVRIALGAELESSPAIQVVSDGAVQETLRLMELPSDAPLQAPVARALARRRGAPFAVVGTIVPVGDGAEVVAQLLDARGGTASVTFSASPPTRDALLPAVARLASGLRRRIQDLPADSIPGALPPATTSSLEALEDYLAARQALARTDRTTAISLLEAALVHDSLFALAHYLVGDELWYVNQQSRAEQHLRRALALAARLTPRERLIIRARYDQLVLDRPDSAIAGWKLLESSYPGDAVAYEGITWAYRALGRWRDAVAAADTALAIDSGPRNRYLVGITADILRDLGDSAGTEAWLARWAPADSTRMEECRAFWRRDWETLLARHPDDPREPAAERQEAAYHRQRFALAAGDLTEGSLELGTVLQGNAKQLVPRALLLQARAELALGGAASEAARLGGRALAWLRASDLSPPAYARIGERVAEIGARAGDRALVDSVRSFLTAKDGGSGLASYGWALRAVAADEAFGRHDWSAAARLAHVAAQGTYFGRSLYSLYLLEADAARQAADLARADSLVQVVVRRGTGPGDRLTDGDTETWEVLAGLAAQRGTMPSSLPLLHSMRSSSSRPAPYRPGGPA